MRDTTVTRDGYLLVAASDAQVDLIDEVRRLPFLQPGVDAAVAGAVAAIAAAGYPHIGTWKEDAFRTTMVFGDAKRGYLMYTIFNFEMAHAKVSAVGEFARFRIKGSPAVLALSVNPAATKGLWKLAFWRNGAGHEIYLTEKSPAHPERDHNRQRLLKLGEALAN